VCIYERYFLVFFLIFPDDALEHLYREIPDIDIWLHREDLLRIVPGIFCDFSLLYLVYILVCLHEKYVFRTRLVHSCTICVGEVVARDGKWVHGELLAAVREDLFSIHLEKSRPHTELFSHFSDHGFMERFSRLYVTSWKDPGGIFFMAS
jgi:hypothetical protein